MDNKNMINSVVGTSNVLMDKAAAADTAAEAKVYMEAAARGFDIIEKLEKQDLEEWKAEADAEYAKAKLEAENEKFDKEQAFKMSTWEREGRITPRLVVDGLVSWAAPVATVAGAVIGGLFMVKQQQMKNETTIEGLKAATRYQENDALEKGALDVVSKAEKLG